MKSDWLERMTLLVGEEKYLKLKNANILIVGVGGVGGFAAEFLARAGVENLTIADGDVVDATNKNRQIIALDSTIGQSKVDLVAQRLKDINPLLNIDLMDAFLTPESMHEVVGAKKYDFVLDCIDSLTPKFSLILACKRHNVPFISSMGAGGKICASEVKIENIWRTKNDKLAYNIRKRLRKQNILRGFKVVYSSEPINEASLQLTENANFKKSFYGTISYMPALFGLHMSEYVLRKLMDA